jgi:hypothetical protein
MGNGIAHVVASTALTSLNKLFSDNLAATKKKYKALSSPDVFPKLLVYTSNPDRRVWRRRTLRHAGWLFTSELDLTSDASPYPARDFARWLKWLTWLQTAEGDVTVTEGADVVRNGETPAEAIMGTLKIALEDTAHNPVHFRWAEGDNLTVNVDRTPGQYSIEVISIRANHGNIAGIKDNDEDQNLPTP